MTCRTPVWANAVMANNIANTLIFNSIIIPLQNEMKSIL